MPIGDMYQIVQRDYNGKVIQTFEVYVVHLAATIMNRIADMDPMHSLTIKKVVH